MTRDEVVAQTEAHVQALSAGESTGHDWWHVERVRRLAGRLAAEEGADPYVVDLAALLHDVADWKFHDGDAAIGPQTARSWLNNLGVDPAVTAHVAAIVGDLSFKGAGVARPMRTPEGRAVQDADRLDAIGAIGVARAFAYGGWKGQPLHEPGESPTHHDSAEAYRTASGSTIVHFHEKLLLLKDLMNTETARRIAAERHQYMEEFLARFHAEWDSRDERPR